MSARTITGPRPRQVSDLVQDLQRARGNASGEVGIPAGAIGDRDVRGDRGRAVFLIGAGCSASADIPLAWKVARDAVVQLSIDYGVADPGVDGDAALAALVASGKFPDRYSGPDGPRWNDLYGYVFSEHMKHPNEQRDFIARLVGHREFTLNWAHACLGALVEKRFVHTVLTTNFDQLALQGVIRTGIVPVVADGLESLNRISPTPARPQIVHLHGSMHTYELRNSYAALRETQDDRGLQVMMMSLLREATVLVVVGYAGGEEGVMTLLQYAAKALPRMVLYWIAYEDDLDLLSARAKELMACGENKFFILGQRADDFFNQVVGELGIGAPDWVSDPLAVLQRQSEISVDKAASRDVGRLVEAYAERIRDAAASGSPRRSPSHRATEFRSALRFQEAATVIEEEESGYADDDELLSIHADSLFGHYKRRHDRSALTRAVEEFRVLVERTGTSRTADIITFIEAQREQSDFVREDDAALSELYGGIERLAEAVKEGLDDREDRHDWSLMSFYSAEAVQAQAEQERRGEDVDASTTGRNRRKELLDSARRRYAAALPGLAATDAIKARECKEGLAGALIALAEYEGDGMGAASRLREAQTLSREVVESARINTPGAEYAGALQNLAEAMKSMRRKFNDEAHGSRGEEADVIRKALAIYEELGETAKVDEMRNLLHKGD